MSLVKLAKHCFWALLSLALTGVFLAACAYFYLSLALPNVETLKTVQLQEPLRIYTHSGLLIAEFGEKRRIPVDYDQVPKPLIEAILATEDQRYFDHPGVDLYGLVRAARMLILTGKKVQGASTITMQVARNFFLSRKKTYIRKINEILLALKIDQNFSKQKILELYLNKIYLGQRAYGVAAAAQVYYGKTLNQLTLPQMAMIAGLPQAPSRDNPVTNPSAAKLRRNHVLKRMFEHHFIDQPTYLRAVGAPITAHYHHIPVQVKAPYVAEMVRQMMVEKYGDAAYTKGFSVYTTVDKAAQLDANAALRQGLIQYSQRHGYLGPEAHWQVPSDGNVGVWQAKLKNIYTINGLQPAVVIRVNERSAKAMIADGQVIDLNWQALAWARPYINGKALGPPPQRASEVVKVGDVIRVYQVTSGSSTPGEWQLSQLPKVQGAIVALQPDSGATLAMTGGFSYAQSHFNRVLQAERQAGSSFKPFIYSAALAKGYTLASLINDAPIVEEDSGGENELWRPQNDNQQFAGPTRLVMGLIKSRNLISIRLLQTLGIDYTIDYLAHFGFAAADLPHSLSLALGSGLVTPMQMAQGFAVFASGGHKVTPYIISKITDEQGQVIYEKSAPENPEYAITPQNAYLINSALEQVIKKGTGRRARVLKRNDLAGKTGTTNQQKDAWFVGYNGDVVTAVWVGFDKMDSLYEYGAQAALPIWIDFMGQYLHDKPEHALKRPLDIVSVRINPQTGEPVAAGERGIFELFRKEYAPNTSTPTSTVKEDQNNNAPAQIF